MKNILRILTAVILLAGTLAPPAMADGLLVKFKGGIGVNPVSSAAGAANTDGTFPNVTRNDVRGIPPGGQPWVIESLRANVMADGRIRVDGMGLLLAGGNGIGTNGDQQVRAVLFCGPVPGFTAHSSGLVALEANGDFRIDDILAPSPPFNCDNPVLLIVNAGGRWFAAGILQQ
jgi:hypothetical protein